jgi:sulfonate transport system substrate-binding protein
MVSSVFRGVRGFRERRGIAALLLTVTLVTSACGHKSDATSTARPAQATPLARSFPSTTRLVLGDPLVQMQLGLDGRLGALPFVAEFQNLSGGPQTIEAFRAGALDASTVGDTPPIHAAFTGLDVKILSAQFRERPTFQLAAAPGVHLGSIADLRGKKIAYSPGQAQGALVLRVLKKAGLTRHDVTLIEIESPLFKDALASRQVDVAPLSGPILVRYLREQGPAGASAIAHGVRDNLSFFSARSSVLDDPDRAAALRHYVQERTRAQIWAADHPDAWIEAYYVKDQGLTAEQGRELVETAGRPVYPADWVETIAETQETIDLLAEATGRASFDAKTIFDRRFETVAAEADADARVTSRTPAGKAP